MWGAARAGVVIFVRAPGRGGRRRADRSCPTPPHVDADPSYRGGVGMTEKRRAWPFPVALVANAVLGVVSALPLAWGFALLVDLAGPGPSDPPDVAAPLSLLTPVLLVFLLLNAVLFKLSGSRASSYWPVNVLVLLVPALLASCA